MVVRGLTHAASKAVPGLVYPPVRVVRAFRPAYKAGRENRSSRWGRRPQRLERNVWLRRTWRWSATLPERRGYIYGGAAL